MTVSERKQMIYDKLAAALHPKSLQVIDESHLHIGHAGAKSGASHFAVEISAENLHGLSKVKQHQKIYELVGFLIPKEVHALRIVIL